MKTYWDLSEKERAALTREQVEAFEAAELMLKGVLAVAPLELVEVPGLQMATVTVYRIGGEFSSLSIAFESAAAAQAFLDLKPLVVERDGEPDVVDVVRPLGSEPVRVVSLPQKDTAQAKAALIKQVDAAKKENARRKQAHEEELKKVEQATRGLWDDWHSCRERAATMARIAETFDKYIAIAGSEETAAKFLAQAFPAPDIAEAATWADRPVMVAPLVLAEAQS